MVEFPICIPTSLLRISDLPDTSASWHAIGRFALTFDRAERDPYRIHDQDFKLFTKQSSVVELRARLFVEQRRWNHFGRLPDKDTMTEIRRIVGLLRDKLQFKVDEPE